MSLVLESDTKVALFGTFVDEKSFARTKNQSRNMLTFHFDTAAIFSLTVEKLT